MGGPAWDREAPDGAGRVQELTDCGAVGGALGRPRPGLSREAAVCTAWLVGPREPARPRRSPVGPRSAERKLVAQAAAFVP